MVVLDSSSRADKELAELYEAHVDTVYRLCFMYLKNAQDAEDAVSTVFIKLMDSRINFNDNGHVRAWLIRVAGNTCKDTLKHWWKKRRVSLDDLPEVSTWDNGEQANAVRAALLSLPEKYKTVLYLYYFEGYSVREMSSILGRKESTLQTQLAKGRELLKIDLGGQFRG